jgi:hypothetical protein
MLKIGDAVKRVFREGSPESDTVHKVERFNDDGTKAAFKRELRARLLATYEWAKDSAKLDRFMAGVDETINTDKNKVSLDSPMCMQAWRAIGMKGKPTYKAVRALPSG